LGVAWGTRGLLDELLALGLRLEAALLGLEPELEPVLALFAGEPAPAKMLGVWAKQPPEAGNSSRATTGLFLLLLLPLAGAVCT
jgi:hypothetical protein